MTNDVLKQIWPEWEIEETPLGRGSFGVVYKAVRKDHNVESYAAIKVISIPSDPSEVDSLRSEGMDINATKTFLHNIVDDFVNEIQLMESLKGVQNIVSVEDYKVVEKNAEIGWDIYIRMELLTPFNKYTCDKKLTEKEVIKLGCDICTALEICGKRNIIHRDIKPENIFINDFGDFKLGDFGIARKLENMTGGLSQKGTFNYMAPEVATGSKYDSRVDTYSLGIVLYRLLNGNRLPFLDTEKQILNPNERRNAVDRRLQGEAPPPPFEASPEMADVILRACAYAPEMRFSSATEMKNALVSVANGTYQVIGTSDPNGTISVHRIPIVSDRQADGTINPEIVAGEPNGTISVRKAPNSYNQPVGQPVNTFGSAPKKNLKVPIIAASIFAAAAIVCVALLVIPNLVKNGKGDNSNGISLGSVNSEKTDVNSGAFDTSVSGSADSSNVDEERINAIISESDELAATKDYEGALAKIKTGLSSYPDSKVLQKKEKEYTSARNTQIKEKAVTEADALAASGDYDGAVKKINEAITQVGEDTELSQKSNDYQVSSYIGKAEALAAANNYIEAFATLDTAQQIFGRNERIDEKRFSIQKMQLLNTVVQYETTSDYAAAIGAIEENNASLRSDAEVVQKLNSLKTAYREQTLSTAANMFESSGYSDAVDVLNKGLTVLPNDSVFLEKIAEYESYKPIPLHSFVQTDSNGCYSGQVNRIREKK